MNNRHSMAILITFVLIAGSFTVCFTANDSNASSNTYETYNEENNEKSDNAIISTLTLEGVIDEYNLIPSYILISICIDALVYSEKGDGTYDADKFNDVYLDRVNEYIVGFSGFSIIIKDNDSDVTDNIIQLNSSNDGVTKLEKHHWGYRVYLSKGDIDRLTTGGGTIAGIISTLIKLGVGTNIALIIATGVLSILLSYKDYNGIVFDIVTSKDIKILGHRVSIPIEPMIQNISEQ